MNRIEVNVSGPTQCGKSIVLAAIDKALRDLGVEFRLSGDLEIERNLANPDSPAEWELEILKNAYIVLTETNIPRH